MSIRADEYYRCSLKPYQLIDRPHLPKESGAFQIGRQHGRRPDDPTKLHMVYKPLQDEPIGTKHQDTSKSLANAEALPKSQDVSFI